MWKLWMVRGRGGWGAGRRLAEGAVLQTIKYLLNCHLSSPPQRRGQGWWFALPRSSGGAIKMRRRHLESVSAVLYGRCFGSFVFSRSLAAKRFAKGKARFPFALFCFLLQEQKEGPRGERC